MKNETIIISKKEKHSKSIYWIFFAIVAFVFVLFPFFMTSLRYQVGTILSKVFVTIGAWLVLFGGLFIIYGIVQIFLRSKGWIKTFVVGLALLWIGFFLTGTTFEIFGFILGGNNSPRGWY